MLGNSVSLEKFSRNTLKSNTMSYHRLQLYREAAQYLVMNQIEICNMIRRVYQIIKWSKKMIL